MRLEAAAAGTASWTGNPFLPPPRAPGRRPRGHSRARRGPCCRPRGAAGGGGDSPRAAPLPLGALLALSPRSRASGSLPPRARPASGPPSPLHGASPGRREKLLPGAQTPRPGVPVPWGRGDGEFGAVPFGKSRGKCQRPLWEIIVCWGGEEKNALQPSSWLLPSPLHACDIAVATKEEVETVVEEQVANTLPCKKSP